VEPTRINYRRKSSLRINKNDYLHPILKAKLKIVKNINLSVTPEISK